MLGSLSNSKNFLFQIFLLTILFLARKVFAEVTILPVCGRASDDITPESTTAICNKSGGGTITTGNYCINEEKTELYKSDSTKCEKVTLVANTYYVFVCTDANTCALKTGSDIDGIANDASLLVYQYVDSKLKQIKNNRYVFVKGSTYHKLISCPKGALTFATNGKCEIATAGIYMNPKTESSVTDPLIVVAVNTSNGDKRDASSKTPAAGETYLYGDSNTKLIKCSSATSCEPFDPEIGKYINSGAATANLIDCTGAPVTCSSGAVAADAIYLNLAVTGTLTNALVSCENDKGACNLIDGDDGKYYMQGVDESGKLIKCTTAEGCVIDYNTSRDGVYLDAGSDDANIIKCPTPETCAKVAATNSGDTYLDGSNGKNLITDGGAKFTSELTSGVTGTVYYVDKLKEATRVLACTSSGCQSLLGSKLQGHAYIMGVAAGKKNKIITYNKADGSKKFEVTDNESGIAAEGDNLYYIDGSNPKNLISCIGATGGGECTSTAPTMESNQYLFYSDATDANNKHTIVCSSDGCVSSKGLQYCTNVDPGDNSGCKNGDNEVGDGFCISTDGKIYTSSSGSSCDEEDNSNQTVFTDSNFAAKANGDDNIYIYVCNSSNVCTQIISSGYKDDSNLYSCDDGTCTKQTSFADGQTFLSGVATINDNPPYLTSGLVHVSGKTIEDCEIVTSKPSGIYLNSAVTKSLTNALIKCKSGKCSAIDSDNNENDDEEYYISSKSLIKCDTSKCETVDDLTSYTSGYLLDYDSQVDDRGIFTKLISCTSDECTSVTPVVGSYINKGETGKIINCYGSREVYCEALGHGGADAKPTYYYDGISKKLISCNDSGCSFVDKNYKGYFLNSGSSTKPIIKCTGAATNPCTAEEVTETTCSKAGRVKKVGGDIYLCVSANDADDHINITTATKQYRSVVTANEFPGNNVSTDFTVRVDSDGKVLLMEDGISLPVCGNTCEDATKHCLDGTIIKTKSGEDTTCVPITNAASTPNPNPVLYFKEDTTKVDAGNVDSNVVYAYKCTYSNTANTSSTYDATSCEIIKGYVATNIGAGSTNSLYCSGWKYDICTFAVTASGLGTNPPDAVHPCEKVKLINTGKICTDSTGVALAPGNVLFYPTEANEYYGIRLTSNSGFVGLELTANSAMVTSNLNFNKYGYQINPAALGSLEKALIKCTTPSTISSCIVVDAKEGYYQMGNTSSDPVKGDGSKPNIIKCTSDGCVEDKGGDGEYYIDASDSSKIIQCVNNDGIICKSIPHQGSASSPTHYASAKADAKVLYTCNNEGCIDEGSTIKGYFLNSAGTSGKTLIECNGTECVEFADVETYSGIGTVKVTDGHAFLCVDVGCNGAGEVEIKTLSTPIYKTIISDNLFPGSPHATDITVKFDKDGSVFLLDPINYGSTAGITETTVGTYVYFFNINGNRVNPPTSGTLPNVSAYQCEYKETDNELDDGTLALEQHCVQVKGFAKIPGTSNFVQCSGWRREGCTITTLKSCDPEDEGKLGTGNKICLGTETLSLPTGAYTVYTAIKIQDINTYYGKGKSDSAISLKLTSTSAIAVDPGDSKHIIKVGNEYNLYNAASNAFSKNTDGYTIDLYNEYFGNTYGESELIHTIYKMLFSCYKGTCSKSNGYILFKGKVYENSSSGTGEWTEVPEASQVCASSTDVGKIKYDSTNSKIQLCIPGNPSPTLVDIGANIYFLPSGNNLNMYIGSSKYSNKVIGTHDPMDGYYYIKDNKKETTVDTTNGKLVKCKSKTCTVMSTIDDGFYLNVFTDKLVKYTSTGGSQTHEFVDDTGYYLDNEKALVYCDESNKCSYSDEIGYFKNAGDTTTNIYIQCSINGCKAIPDSTAECNSDSQIGHLTKEGELCLKNGVSKEFESSTPSTQLVYYQSGSVFKHYINKSTYFGLIKVTTDSMVLDFNNLNSDYCVDSSTLVATATTGSCISPTPLYHCNVDGVCVDSTSEETLPESIRNQKIVAEVEEEESTSAMDLKIECDVRSGENCDNDYYLVSKEENYALGEDHGALFYCDPEKQKPICTEIFDVGYYIKDKEAIFSCKAGSNGLDCSLNKLTDENNACNTNSIGKPFLNQNKLALCLDYDEGATTAYAIDLTPTTSGNYLIKKDSSNLFDIPSDRDYAIVSVKEKIITINLNYTNKLKYVYANKDAKMKLLEKGDTCPKSNGALDETKILELNCVNSKCTTNLNLS